MTTPQDDGDTSDNQIPIDWDAIPRDHLRAAAKRIVSAPANGLILCAMISMLTLSSFAYLTVKNPEGLYNFLASAGLPEKDDRSLEERQAEMEENRRNFVESVKGGPAKLRLVIPLVGSFLVILGGIAMHRLQSRRFCLLAAGMAVVPLIFVPCCVGIIFGIWAIMALNREEVVRAFQNG